MQLSASPYPAGFIPQGIALGSGGQYLYAGNEGDGNISIFKVDPTTGVLSPNGSFVEGNPSFLAEDTSGQNLLVLGQASSSLAAYKINANTGGLSRLSSVTAGTSNLPAMAVLQLK
jgi:6-phosphogluconolactonase